MTFLFSYQGGYPFRISLYKALPDNVSAGVAKFGEVGTALLRKRDPFNFEGQVPGN